MKKIIVEIDSYGVSVYRVVEKDRELMLTKKIDFERYYDPAKGELHFHAEEGLVRFLERVSANFFDHHIYASSRGVFDQLSDNYRAALSREIWKRAKIRI